MFIESKKLLLMAYFTITDGNGTTHEVDVLSDDPAMIADEFKKFEKKKLINDKKNKNVVKSFTSQIDGSQFDYFISDNILSFRIEGTDWQDFVPNDKRAYTKQQHQEMMSLLEDYKNN